MKNEIHEIIRALGSAQTKESIYYVMVSMRQFKHMGDVLLARENEKDVDEMYERDADVKKDVILIRDAVVERNNILNNVLDELSKFGINVPKARVWQYDVTLQLNAVVGFLKICATSEAQELIRAAM